MYLLSIDVEDWFHSSQAILGGSSYGAKPHHSVVQDTLKILDYIGSNGSKATFFIIGTVAEHYPDIVQEIVRRGHEVGSHSYAHRLVYEQTPQEFETDLKKSLDCLYKAGAREVRGYRAPYFSITKKSLWALPIIASCGFVYDASVFPISRKFYGIPDAPRKPYQIHGDLWEFPAATWRFGPLNVPVAGGGYLRVLPYELFSFAVRQADQGDPLVFYFHTYELNPQDIQPPEGLKGFSRLRALEQRIGRNSNPQKIQRFLKQHTFSTIQSVWEKYQSGGVL